MKFFSILAAFVAACVTVSASAFAQAPAVSTECAYECRLQTIEGMSTAIQADIRKMQGRLDTLEKNEEAKKLARRIGKLKTQLDDLRQAHETTGKTLIELGEIQKKTAQLSVELSQRLAAVEKKVNEHDEALAEHGKKLEKHEKGLKNNSDQLERHDERLEATEAKLAGNAVTVEAVLVGNKQGAGGGALIGFAFGLESRKVFQLRAGVTNSLGGEAFGVLLTAALLFPWEDHLKVAVGGYSLTDFDRLPRKGISTKVWEAGLMLGPVYQQGIFTGSLTGGVGGSIQLDGRGDPRLAFVVVGTLGVRL